MFGERGRAIAQCAAARFSLLLVLDLIVNQGTLSLVWTRVSG